MIGLSHLDDYGKLRMVDISDKNKTNRTAVAQAVIKLKQSTLEKIFKNEISKGNVITAAKIAGTQAAKNTPHLIPLCHSIAVCWIDISISRETDGLSIVATVKALDSTGVEMESLVAVSISALTIYDMCKAVDTAMEITDIKLISKTGGKKAYHNK